MKSPDSAKDAILDAAEQLFVRYGFKKTSIDDVARAARIGKGSVYLHFSSKEELFAEIVRRVADRLLETLTAAVKRARTPGAKLRAFVHTELTTVAEIAEEYHLTEEALMEILPMAAMVREGYLARERALLEEILREGVAAGAFTVEHPGRLAVVITTGLAALQTSVPLRVQGDADVRAGLDELMSVFLRGLSRDPKQAS